jgi:hypothetical protein
LQPQKSDLIDVMQAAISAMQAVVAEKIHLFGSHNLASMQ